MHVSAYLVDTVGLSPLLLWFSRILKMATCRGTKKIRVLCLAPQLDRHPCHESFHLLKKKVCGVRVEVTLALGNAIA